MADGCEADGEVVENSVNEDNKIPLYKIVLVGEMEVGKTSLFKRYDKNTFSELRTTTQGVDNCRKLEKIAGKPCKINLWDTAGMERLGSLTSNYYHRSAAVALVYSVDEINSLTSLRYWIEDADRYAKGAKKFLIGNKVDLEKERLQVEENTAVSFARNNEISNSCVFRVSAKTGEGVHAMFKNIARELMEHAKPTMHREDAFQIHVGREEEKRKGGCMCYST